MTPHKSQSYPVGMVAFALLLAVFKAVSLAAEMGAGWPVMVLIAGLDAFFLAFLFMLALLTGMAAKPWLRRILHSLLAALTLLYLVDSFVLMALGEHASLFDIGRYTPEWGVVTGFFNTATHVAIVLFLVSLFVFAKSTRGLKRWGAALPVVMLLLAAISFYAAPPSLTFYSMISPQSMLEHFGPRNAAAIYSDSEIEFYAGLKREAVAVPASKPDIILLVMESLSSINSKKVSGLPGVLDSFDKLAGDGTLFTNFFANHQASEGGLIALLGGFPPMHFPTATPYMFDEFAVQASVIAAYREQGYHTEFLTNADLGFIGLDHFLNGLGVDRKRGRDEVDAMKTAPRVVQEAPSDAFLYQEATRTVSTLMSLDQPFLLTIATTSTHLPYTHPEAGPDTAAAVWEWSLQQLLGFYGQLSAGGFFDHGLLLITGDHRQMRPLSLAEIERYGDSARARVPLLVIGKDVSPGLVDARFFQQSDLLRMLGNIHNVKTSLSPHPIWVERYNRKYGRSELIDSLTIFDETDQGRKAYRVEVPGNRVEWLDGKPLFARQLETRIHMQRSLHQQVRQHLNNAFVKTRKE